jgi:hypothetical protein
MAEEVLPDAGDTCEDVPVGKISKNISKIAVVVLVFLCKDALEHF